MKILLIYLLTLSPVFSQEKKDKDKECKIECEEAEDLPIDGNIFYLVASVACFGWHYSQNNKRKKHPLSCN